MFGMGAPPPTIPPPGAWERDMKAALSCPRLQLCYEDPTQLVLGSKKCRCSRCKQARYRSKEVLHSDTGTYQFGFLLFNLLIRSSVAASGAMPGVTSSGDGSGLMRDAPYAHAAARRAVEL